MPPPNPAPNRPPPTPPAASQRATPPTPHTATANRAARSVKYKLA